MGHWQISLMSVCLHDFSAVSPTLPNRSDPISYRAHHSTRSIRRPGILQSDRLINKQEEKKTVKWFLKYYKHDDNGRVTGVTRGPFIFGTVFGAVCDVRNKNCIIAENASNLISPKISRVVARQLRSTLLSTDYYFFPLFSLWIFVFRRSLSVGTFHLERPDESFIHL